MKLLLIQPKNTLNDFFGAATLGKFSRKKYGAMPLGLPTVAALTPPGVSIKLIDENIEKIDFSQEVDLVGITCNTVLSDRAYEIADNFRKRNKIVILGGIHPTFLPDESLYHANSIVMGEAENTWEEAVKDFLNNKLKTIYKNQTKPDLELSPIPRWDLLKLHLYQFHTIQVGRGCNFDCDFCSVKIFTGANYRHKSLEQVIEELNVLKHLADDKYIFFVDDNILTDRIFIKELFEKIIPFKIRWFAQSSINVYRDLDLLKLMYSSGCRQLFIGFESLSQDTLNSINKGKVNRVEEYKKAVDIIQSNKISVYGSFMFGGDHETNKIFKTTVDFINDSGILFSLISILTPPPATRLFKKLESENRLLHKDWKNYTGGTVCFKPNFMTESELRNGYLWTLKEIYSFQSISKRINILRKINLFRSSKKKSLQLILSYFILKFLISVRILKTLDFDSIYFVLQNLWHPKGTSITSILLALSAHEYVMQLNDQTPCH